MAKTCCTAAGARRQRPHRNAAHWMRLALLCCACWSLVLLSGEARAGEALGIVTDAYGITQQQPDHSETPTPTRVDDRGDPAVPMCAENGSSMAAPPVGMPAHDGTIERGAPCYDELIAALGLDHDDDQAQRLIQDDGNDLAALFLVRFPRYRVSELTLLHAVPEGPSLAARRLERPPKS